MSRKKSGQKKIYVKAKISDKVKNKTSNKVKEELIGRVDMSSDGYGFFIPEDSKLKDIFIPKTKLNGAMHKDRVKVKIEIYKGRKEAHVIEIIERGFSRLIGRVDKSDHFSYVIPFVKKFGFDVYIPKKFAGNLKDDDVVICEITKFPQKGKNPEGKILRILGNLHDKGIENDIVLEKYEIRRKFPIEVINEVNENVKSLFKKAEKRTDFRDLFTVTIDGETARDFDDAISIKVTENGYILYVHIADVAHFVRHKTKLDKEAYLRGTSVYFPEFAIPMLPEELSNDACSLKPNVERLTMTVEIFYNEKGERVKSNIYQSVIKSNYRLTYNYVNDLIEGLKDCDDIELKNLIDNGVSLLKLLMDRREEQGMIDFDLAEVEFIFDDNGDIIDIKPLERKISHRMIEFFMVEANEAVAEFLAENYDRAVFRVHGAPDTDKLLDFVSTFHIYGIETGIIDNFDSKAIQQLSKIISNSKFSYLLSSMLVKTMQKAVYSPDNIGHFGLSSSCYTHFTSPIRRYPDLVVHRLIKSKLFNYNFKIDDNYLEETTLHSSRMEQLSEDAEREIHLFKKLKFIESHVDEQFDAFINRLNGNGVFVYVEKFLITGFISIENMLGDNYNYIESQNIFLGKKTKKRLKLGDKIRVKLFRVNYDYLEASFVLDM
ncbi:MAG: ribonuclease R [Calditerrivibrio sp.]|nr:ribonuclease R [Calditerrivibrio sp.]